MATDVFNNSSNNYVYPALSPCAGTSDNSFFRFLPKKQAGIVSGADILATFNLSDIEIPVTTWLSQKKYLQPGEVTYIPGLTKGLVKRTQYFKIPFLEISPLQNYFFQIDLSINYYSNFRFFDINLFATADWSLNVDIDDALNIEFGNNKIKATAIYDPDYYSFVGDNEGFEFNVTAATLMVIDASMDPNSPIAPIIDPSTGERIPQVYELQEDLSKSIPSAKYPNGAMRGYIIKANYPNETSEFDSWLYMNHVVCPFTFFEAVDVSVDGGGIEIYYEKLTKKIDVGMSGIGNVSTMSAGEYLDYVNTYNMWEKFGDFRGHFSTADPAESNLMNLINGFYVFNPHTFPVQIDYLLIN